MFVRGNLLLVLNVSILDDVANDVSVEVVGMLGWMVRQMMIGLLWSGVCQKGGIRARFA